MSAAETTVVARFTDPWDAELARHYLQEAGIEAWVESSLLEFHVSGEGGGRIRLRVPEHRVEEARAILAEMQQSDELVEEPTGVRRPLWVAVVAAILAGGLLIGAVPRVLWGPLLLLGFIGFLLWRAAGPRRPAS